MRFMRRSQLVRRIPARGLPALPAISTAAFAPAEDAPTPTAAKGVPVLAIHGGAGTIAQDRITSETQAASEQGLRDALRAGQAVLVAGGSALDAGGRVAMPFNPGAMYRGTVTGDGGPRVAIWRDGGGEGQAR
jgi:hypothetical protein